MPITIAKRLLTKNAVDDTTSGHRLGMIHFCSSRALLRNESGVCRLLGLWGGEALYWAHENDTEVALVLKRLGKPTIVLAAVRISAIEDFDDLGKHFLNNFLHQRGVVDRPSPFDGYTYEAISCENIIRFISLGEHEFESLTNTSTWQTPLSST